VYYSRFALQFILQNLFWQNLIVGVKPGIRTQGSEEQRSRNFKWKFFALAQLERWLGKTAEIDLDSTLRSQSSRIPSFLHALPLHTHNNYGNALMGYHELY